MRWLWTLSIVCACTIPAGEHHQVRGVVHEVGGSTLVLDHEGVPGVMEAARTSFLVDPNLSRKVKAGDEILANLLVGEGDAPSRVIGVEPAR